MKKRGKQRTCSHYVTVIQTEKEVLERNREINGFKGHSRVLSMGAKN